MNPLAIRRRGSSRVLNGTDRPTMTMTTTSRPALAIVDVDVFNYCLRARYLVSTRPPAAFTSGPLRHDNTSATAVENGALLHRDCVISYRTSADGTCVAGTVTLPTPLQPDVSRVVVSLAPLEHYRSWRAAHLEVQIRIVRGEVTTFSTRWTS